MCVTHGSAPFSIASTVSSGKQTVYITRMGNVSSQIGNH